MDRPTGKRGKNVIQRLVEHAHQEVRLGERRADAFKPQETFPMGPNGRTVGHQDPENFGFHTGSLAATAAAGSALLGNRWLYFGV